MLAASIQIVYLQHPFTKYKDYSKFQVLLSK